MELVFEKGEKERLRDGRKEIMIHHPGGILFDDNEPDREYSLSFTVRDPAIAEYILLGLLHHKENIYNKIDLGIDIKSIDVRPRITNKDEVCRKLHDMIDKIIYE